MTFAASAPTSRIITSLGSPIGSKDRSRVNRLSRGIRLAREVMRFGLEGRGALTFGMTTAQVFCRSTPEKASPDLQLLFTPASYDEAKFVELEREDGMTVAVCPVRPDSRGTIMARSPDATEAAGHYAELSIRSHPIFACWPPVCASPARFSRHRRWLNIALQKRCQGQM